MLLKVWLRILFAFSDIAVWNRDRRRAHRVLGFRRALPIDVVLTTSSVEAAGHGVPARRPLTGYGQVRGVASCARALAAYYPSKEVFIHLSGFVRNRLDRDLILLGGPAKNEMTRIMLNEVSERYDIETLEFDDIMDSVKVSKSSGRELRIDNFDPQLQDGIPQVDIFLIAAMTRPKADGSSTRCILCAGFTSYGTGAAAEYMLVDLPKLRAKDLARLLRSGPTRSGAPRDFIIVAKANFSSGECTNIELLFETILCPAQLN